MAQKRRGREVSQEEVERAFEVFQLHYKIHDSNDYSCEEEINHKLGITL